MIRKLLFILVTFGSATAEFSFPVHKPVIYRPTGRVFTAAEQKVKDNDLALAYSQRDKDSFTGIAPKEVSLNGEQSKRNPLFGAKIDHLVMLARRPLVSVTNRVYLTDERANPINVFQSPMLMNASGKVINSILALTSNATELRADLKAEAPLAALAAVPNMNGGFDGNGSGIAVAYFKSVVKKEVKGGKTTKTPFMTWDIIDATTGASSYDNNGMLTTKGNKAKPFGKDSPEVFIGQPVKAIGTEIDLHFDREMGRLYMALQVDAESGARAVVVGQLTGERLMFQKIAPDEAFAQDNAIVGQGVPGTIGIKKFLIPSKNEQMLTLRKSCF